MLSGGASLPWAWYLLFVLMVLAYVIDCCRQHASSSRFARAEFPERIDEKHDRQLDCAIARTKWLLYGAIRSFLFALVFAYMGVVCVLALVAHGGVLLGSGFHALYFGLGVVIVAGAAGHSGYTAIRAVRRYFVRYRAFGRCVGATLVPESVEDVQDGMKPSGSAGRPRVAAEDGAADAGNLPSNPPPGTRPDSKPPSSRRPLSERVPLALGVLEPVGIIDVARTSFAQLRNLTVLAGVLALGLVGALVLDTWSATDAGVDVTARPQLTLVALRAASLLSGVSPSAPALLCMAAIYVWAVGRMARLALAHSLSRGCPDDAEMDLVSTPMRLILYPGYSRRQGSDAGFTEVERNLSNAIWRPITGRYYPWATLALVLCPLIVFTLKPLSTLEGCAGTLYLGGALALSAVLIGSTLLQLVQFWLAFERLLKRTMEHPLSPAFRTLPPFAQDSVDHQVSRSPDELLRWSACARLFHDLTRSAPALVPPQLIALKNGICEARERALLGFQAAEPATPGEHPSVPPPDNSGRDAVRAELQAALERSVVAAASRVTELLSVHWNAQATAGTPAAQGNSKGSGEPPVERDALWPLEQSGATRELAWLRAAQTFVATVVTLIIHRHARQFRYFLCVTTLCSLLLVCAIASYPFEPYRLLLTYVWVVTGSTVTAGLAVFVQMDRNTLLSHIAGTSPNSVTWNAAFVLRVVAWAVVPLFGVAAAQYPELANFLSELLGPFTRALR
ncbi:MAG TPA: hypothetical protein VLJ38_13335 [Polyangiaceae bacterium]|nr:hypothetical protein [Polyangiaceae bacterium]